MKKYLLTAMIALGTATFAGAQEYETAGDGTTWTLARLAEAGSFGVEETTSGDAAYAKTYRFSGELTIKEGDKFQMDADAMLMMADGARININGEADFSLSGSSETGQKTLITRDAETDNPYGLVISAPGNFTVSGLEFRYAGLKFMGEQEVMIQDCEFRYHNTKSASYAISFGTPNSSYTVSNCIFEQNGRSALGSGANIPVNLTVSDCQFIRNGATNTNYPQLNLTVGAEVVIRHNTIEGDPSRNMVGGLVVANLMGITGDIHTLIEDNEIYDNRFGLALYVTQDAIVRNNILKNNNAETTPNNGGSGINIYDPYYSQNTTITGNWIEGNLWGITVIGGNDINIGKVADKDAADYNPGQNTFLNNGFGGVIYDLYNNSTNTVYAQGNYWKSVEKQDETSIETCIFHKNDDASLGEVIFMPAAEDTGILPLLGTEDAQETLFGIDGMRLERSSNGQSPIRIVKKGQRAVKVMK